MSRYRHRLPEQLGGSIRSELDRLGAADASLAVTRRWVDAVGPAVARNAWPARMRRDGTLVVNARTSIWAFELNQMAEQIRPRLEPTPEGLRFVVGPVPEPVGRAEEDRAEAPVEVDPRAAEAAAELASELSSSEVREALQRAATLALSRRRDDRPM